MRTATVLVKRTRSKKARSIAPSLKRRDLKKKLGDENTDGRIIIASVSHQSASIDRMAIG